MKEFHVKDKLSEYIDGMLSREEVSAVKEHLDRCPECLEEYEEMVKIIGHMNQMECLETPEFFLENVHGKIKKQSSFQRLVKGLLFPLKVKIPLELAGVVAAALLVIYIVGIRGKQQVYELAYTQRSLPLPAIQDQKQVTGAEVDRVSTPRKEAQPELELEEEKKVKKRDKRADTEEPIAPGKKELAALAPQEKRMEKLSKDEEALPHRKAVREKGKERQEPKSEIIESRAKSVAEAPSVTKDRIIEGASFEIADKEVGEAEKDAPTTPTHMEEYIHDIIAVLGGKIIESEYNKDTQVLENLIIEIPSEKYQRLIETLEERGEIQKPYPTIKEQNQEIIQIRIKLQK